MIDTKGLFDEKTIKIQVYLKLYVEGKLNDEQKMEIVRELYKLVHK